MFGSTWPLFALSRNKESASPENLDVSVSLIPPVLIHDHMYFLDCINYVFVGVMNAPPLIGTLEERERESCESLDMALLSPASALWLRVVAVQSSGCGLAERKEHMKLGLLERSLYTHTHNKVQRATKCKHTSRASLCHYTPLLCCVFVYRDVCSYACVWSDSLTTIKQAPAVFITCPTYPDCFVPATRRKHIRPRSRWRSLFTPSAIETAAIALHEAMAVGVRWSCLDTRQRRRCVCWAPMGNSFKPPASGAGRIEHFLLQDV